MPIRKKQVSPSAKRCFCAVHSCCSFSQSGNRGIRFGFVSILNLYGYYWVFCGNDDDDWSSCSVRLVLLLCGLLRRPAAVSPALLLLLRSGLAVRLCGTSGQCGLDLPADARGSLIAERIRATRRVGVYARLVLLEAGVRIAAAASASRIISVVSALVGARRGCLRRLLGLLLGGLLAAGRTLGIRSRLTRLLLGFLFAGHICGDLLGGGVLGDRLAAAALVRGLALTGLALLLLLFLVRNLTGNRNALADQLFDILEVRTLGAVAEGNRGALPDRHGRCGRYGAHRFPECSAGQS